MKTQGNMNHNKGNNMGMGNTTFWGILAVTVITCFDILSKRGYRVRGGGSIGTGKGKKSAWFDCQPGKGGRK